MAGALADHQLPLQVGTKGSSKMLDPKKAITMVSVIKGCLVKPPNLDTLGLQNNLENGDEISVALPSNPAIAFH